MCVISTILIFLWCYLTVSLKYIFYWLKEKEKKKEKKAKLNLYMIKVQKSKLIKIIEDRRRRRRRRRRQMNCVPILKVIERISHYSVFVKKIPPQVFHLFISSARSARSADARCFKQPPIYLTRILYVFRLIPTVCQSPQSRLFIV